MDTKRISDLATAESLLENDLFVIEQGGSAKSITGKKLKEAFVATEDNPGDTTDLTGAVLYNESQALSDEEKTLARSNIGAASEKELSDLRDSIAEVSEIDFTDWEDGGFTVTMDDGTTKDGTVEFDADGNPESITIDGNTLTIILP